MQKIIHKIEKELRKNGQVSEISKIMGARCSPEKKER
jgi:hypothetical protein